MAQGLGDGVRGSAGKVFVRRKKQEMTFDIKTATMADLYAARSYCIEVSKTLRRVETDDSFNEAVRLSILAGNISEEIKNRLRPHLDHIEKTLRNNEN